MGLRRPSRDAETHPDLGVRAARRDQLDDLPLPVGDPQGRRRERVRHGGEATNGAAECPLSERCIWRKERSVHADLRPPARFVTLPDVPATVIVGAQWGDEGKGKIVDVLAQRSDVVCRYQGGPNAGHTIVIDGETYKIRQIPTGVLSGKTSVLAAGCVVDPAV